jgi:Ras-related protein Rab-8A
MVETKDAQALADKNRLIYIETSAKDGTNVNDAFKTLISECVKAAVEHNSKKVDDKKDINLNQNPPPPTGGGCC